MDTHAKGIGAICLAAVIMLMVLSCNRTPDKKQQVVSENHGTTVSAGAGAALSAPAKTEASLWAPLDDSLMVAANKDHYNERLRYVLIESKVSDKNEVFLPLYEAVKRFSEVTYKALEPLVLEQDIPTIQRHIREGSLTYEQLVLFYLHRIYHYELDPKGTLNTVIALNSHVLEEARARDSSYHSAPQASRHPIFGIPILLKDNINCSGMPTTAGAVVLRKHMPEDAFIVARLKEKGALILGKVNLSEWAYWLCEGCPTGYSAVGGQTLNPYGRGLFESGGSSSGSATSVTANYAAAAVGTETSGSILSPSGQNALVGLKPTVGLLSRSGIIPISSTLDTPGPMTKNVIDNGILLDAMLGYDETDDKSVRVAWVPEWYADKQQTTLKGKKFGVFKDLLESDTLYRTTTEAMASQGAILVPLDPLKIAMDGFLSILNVDMKYDLPAYLNSYGDSTAQILPHSVAEIIAFNSADSLIRIPYGQRRMRGVVEDTMAIENMRAMNLAMEKTARVRVNTVMNENRLDALLSVNNKHAAVAAICKYPALGMPMGLRETGEPANITFIAKQYQEEKLYKLGSAFERAFSKRKPPVKYGVILKRALIN